MIDGGFADRKAPYAPISALGQFFEKIRDRQLPDQVDHRFLQKLNVASNNEYALLSALKFLGVLDDRGKPTHAYRLLQTTDRFQETLWHLVQTAYKPVFDLGADQWANDDLVNYFRRTSSASQAKNAARFFLAVCNLAGYGRNVQLTSKPAPPPRTDLTSTSDDLEEALNWPAPAGIGRDQIRLLEAKVRLLEKLPEVHPDWSAAEYQAICDSFVTMLRSLDGLS
ncbi:MAG TPA: DUF5343 domain-containing protein [Chloroflexota bacterium]